MKVKKVLTRFASAPEDKREMRRVARALGNELPRHRLDILQQFRAGLARVTIDGDTYGAGYIAGMLDVTAEYEVFVRQARDDRELSAMALREDWRDVLRALAEGPRLPSDLANRLGKDRPTLTRILKRLRTAGLVEAYAKEGLDGRMRPHRVTMQGRRLLDKLGGDRSGNSAGVERGIAAAVSLFQHMLGQPRSGESALLGLLDGIFASRDQSRAALETWVDAVKKAGLVAEGQLPVDAGTEATESPLWERIPSILSELGERRDDDLPVYVRTDDPAWGAWAYALQNRDSTGLSRTIVKGDILSHSVKPPDQSFALLYDNPDTIRADQKEPTMQAFLDRADEKFVVAGTDEEVPEGFIQLSLASEEE